jgi:hypothetical protein
MKIHNGSRSMALYSFFNLSVGSRWLLPPGERLAKELLLSQEGLCYMEFVVK